MPSLSPSLRPFAFGLATLVAGFAATSAAACPDWTQQGTPIAYSSEQLWAPQAVGVIAGGNVDLASCPMPGHGWVITPPDFDLAFSGNEAQRDLELRVEGACDTVLLVNDAAGNWHFNDDDTDINPRIRIAAAPSGAYDIWVGTYLQQNCEARLVLETFGTPPGGTMPTPMPMPMPMPMPSEPQAMADPGNLMQFRDRVGQTLSFSVTGSDRGSVWGSGVYTDDSALAVAAVHAGALRVGETGVVSVTILPGRQSYEGSAANGVTTSNYGTWQGSYQIAVPQAAAPEAPGNLTTYRDRVGQTFRFTVTGSNTGSVWGSGVYTDDSSVATAAVHAGMLAVGETGTVQVTILPGQASYSGSESNGIRSSDYGTWQGSYQFVMPPSAPTMAPAAPAAPAPAPAAPAGSK